MRRSETIVSAANPLVKDVRRAIAHGGLTAQGLCVAESFHLLEEALSSGCEVPHVLASESACAAAETQIGRRDGIRLAILPDALFRDLATTETSQGVMALVKPPEWKLDQLFGEQSLVVVLDGLQDPGNAGSIVRAAEAFGATGVLFLKGSVSPYNPKTLRGAAGSLFRVPFLAAVEPGLARAQLKRHGVELYAAAPARAGKAVRSLATADLSLSCALVIGSEAHGVHPEWRNAAQALSIPTTGVESLNAAVAAGILLYEARRQRALAP